MSALDDKLAELRQRFRSRARGELEALDASLAGKDRAAVVERAHKLAGIAGMFGHEDIGEAALALEQAAREGSSIEIAAGPLRGLLAKLAAS